MEGSRVVNGTPEKALRGRRAGSEPASPRRFFLRNPQPPATGEVEEKTVSFQLPDVSGGVGRGGRGRTRRDDEDVEEPTPALQPRLPSRLRSLLSPHATFSPRVGLGSGSEEFDDKSPGGVPSALQRIAKRIEKHRNEFRQDIRSWKRLLSQSPERRRREADSLNGKGYPELVSVDATMASTEDASKPHVEYIAHLRLRGGSVEHSWQTEPFRLDDLVAVVVDQRVAYARRLCNTLRVDAVRRHKGLRRCLRCCLLWLFGILISCSVGGWLRPAARVFLPTIVLTYTPFSDTEWVMASLMAGLLLGMAFGLLAGITEMSFLPTKVFLQIVRTDEIQQVKEQLQLLLNSVDCMQNLATRNFLKLGMATYMGSSETQKEGSCYCAIHETTTGYFRKARRCRLGLLWGSCDVRCRLRQSGTRRLEARWLVLRKDGLALFNSVMAEDPTDMLFFDTSFSLFRDDEDRVFVRGASWMLEIDFRGPRGTLSSNVESWCNAIMLTTQLSPRTRQQRYGSFAPIRQPVPAKSGDRHLLRHSMARFMLCGRATFRKIAEAIMMAEHDIFITGWWISPHLRLVREPDSLPGNADPRLSSLVKSAADRGVRVCILIYRETSMVMPMDSEWSEAELQHPNVYVCCHRSRFDANRLWSHHEKLVVVDQQLAFVGGLDMCLGRWDDKHHRLADPEAQMWEDQDYSNPRIMDFSNVRQTGDTHNRITQPRMPWQDVHCVIVGRAARDVARHCIERWNHAKSKRPQYRGYPAALPRRKVAVSNDQLQALLGESADGCWPPEHGAWQEVTAQVVRSVGLWSAGVRTESSVHAAYCELLQEAERFVYIENQFFCSGMDGDEAIGNRVAEALFRRVLRAHQQQEQFHVMMVLPLLPALDGELTPNDTPLLNVIRWQTRTLQGLRQRCEQHDFDFSDYVSVYALRTHGLLPSGEVVTEMIYVHSKVMIVDDRSVIVGSANLNDRSLLGIRDSEVCVVLRDKDMREACLGGPWLVGSLASRWREAIFGQHLGWSMSEMEQYADPLHPDSLQAVRSLAKRNTQIYEEVFACMPSDACRRWSDVQTRRSAFPSRAPGDASRPPSSEDLKKLESVQGHLVEFPLDFLVEEDLAPARMFTVGALAPDAFN
eukprot:TRINITY_DN36467_c0_g2_i1.p1 TRINITY_DN36467_c0_g2~~TRINITY_DN36467_c0_g2_i1.p1  ORF type:complete len:1141 (+),score=223.05 TRINITY_DN36467_c0_g2_i1:50-3424(+)